MQVSQYIITEIIKQVKSEIDKRTGSNSSGSGLSIKDVVGQVVSINTTETGERSYYGIDDTKGTYFYIRLTNSKVSETRKAANTKRGSCGIEQETRLQLKLVAQHNCADALLWAEIVKQALFTVDLKGNWKYSIVNPKLYPISTNINSWEVYNEETGKNPNTLNSLMKIIAIEFELRYDYTYSDKCYNIKLC